MDLSLLIRLFQFYYPSVSFPPAPPQSVPQCLTVLSVFSTVCGLGPYCPVVPSAVSRIYVPWRTIRWTHICGDRWVISYVPRQSTFFSFVFFFFVFFFLGVVHPLYSLWSSFRYSHIYIFKNKIIIIILFFNLAIWGWKNNSNTLLLD